MSAEPFQFKRLVLGLQPDVPVSSIRVAAELAALLGLDLLGLFLDDSSLRDLARIPFAREFRGVAAGWQPIDIDRVARELDVAERSLRRFFEAATEQLETGARFEVMQGPLAESIRSVARAGDIVMVAEPAHPAAQAASQFDWLRAAAFRSAPAVLLVPLHIARTRGPIVAIAGIPDDPSIHAAAMVALAAKEELIVIDADDIESGDEFKQLMREDPVLSVDRFAARKTAFPNPATCAQAFRHIRERLVVMTRSVFDDATASTIASVRHVPVLMIEPRQESEEVAA